MISIKHLPHDMTKLADLYAHFVWLNSGEAVKVERIVHDSFFQSELQMKWRSGRLRYTHIAWGHLGDLADSKMFQYICSKLRFQGFFLELQLLVSAAMRITPGFGGRMYFGWVGWSRLGRIDWIPWKWVSLKGIQPVQPHMQARKYTSRDSLVLNRKQYSWYWLFWFDFLNWH